MLQKGVRDLRHAARGLVRTPGFAIVAILVIAVRVYKRALRTQRESGEQLCPTRSRPTAARMRIHVARGLDGVASCL